MLTRPPDAEIRRKLYGALHVTAENYPQASNLSLIKVIEHDCGQRN